MSFDEAKIKPCCDEFAKNTGKHNEGIEMLEDGRWHVNGCCHGGCFVLHDIKFCPFCGTKLEKPQTG